MKIDLKSPFFWFGFLIGCLIVVGIAEADYGDDLICYPIVMAEEGLTVDQSNPIKIQWDHSLTEEQNLLIIEIKLGEDFVCIIDED